MGEKVQGNLVIIGGSEDKEKDCFILKQVVQLAGGSAARMAVLTTASLKPEQVGKEYIEVFKKLGLKEVSIFNISDRRKACDSEIIKKLKESTGIFFTGGDQLRITGTLGGTELEKSLYDLYRQGVVIAGTSAGASVMSDTMIVGGYNDDTPQVTSLSMAPGLGFLKEVVIDQHFAQRGRTGRLLSVIAHNPYILGIGIDEDTAIVVRSDGHLEVIGSNSATVLDGKNIGYSNVSELEPNQPLIITNVILHTLSSGCRFSLKERKPMIN